MRKNAVFGWIKRRSTMLMAVVAVGGITGLVLLFNIRDLMPGPNNYEISSLQRLSQLGMPWGDAVNYPYYAAAKVLDLVFSPLTALRLTSVLLGFLTILLFSYTIRQWFNNRVAIATTLLFVTSSWFIATSRLGAPYIVGAFWITALAALGTWRTYTTKPLLTDGLIAIAIAISLYTPYFAVLAVTGLVLMAARRRKQLFFKPRKHQWALPLLVVLILAPIVVASIRNIEVAKSLLGVVDLPSAVYIYAKQIGQNLSQLFFRGFSDPAVNLGRLPLLDIFTVVMAAIGVLYYEHRLNLRRSQLIFGVSMVLGLSLSLSVFSLPKLAILMPLVMFLVVGGIVELLDRWLEGFPRNPIARSIGVCVMVVAIGFTSFYHLQRYFVAWTNYPDAVLAHQEQ